MPIIHAHMYRWRCIHACYMLVQYLYTIHTQSRKIRVEYVVIPSCNHPGAEMGIIYVLKSPEKQENSSSLKTRAVMISSCCRPLVICS